jgi:carbamate kinase
MDAGVQRANAARAAASIAAVARSHRVVVTHGNGPQVGLLALQNEAYGATQGYPLDVLGAESEGMIGYLLQQELGRHLDPRRLVTLLTQVEVDPGDPAFATPTKFIGPVYPDRGAVDRMAAERGWTVAADGSSGWRRVVASPEPQSIVELSLIRLLVEEGVTVICAGGGGVPVVRDLARGGHHGVEAVIDKDLSACLLADGLGADALMLLTDVAAVMDGWGTPSARPIGCVSVGSLRARSFPAGSMGPKVDAVCRFVEGGGGRGGRLGAIGALDDAAAILAGRAGTRVVADR